MCALLLEFCSCAAVRRTGLSTPAEGVTPAAGRVYPSAIGGCTPDRADSLIPLAEGESVFTAARVQLWATQLSSVAIPEPLGVIGARKPVHRPHQGAADVRGLCAPHASAQQSLLPVGILRYRGTRGVRPLTCMSPQAPRRSVVAVIRHLHQRRVLSLSGFKCPLSSHHLTSPDLRPRVSAAQNSGFAACDMILSRYGRIDHRSLFSTASQARRLSCRLDSRERVTRLPMSSACDERSRCAVARLP